MQKNEEKAFPKGEKGASSTNRHWVCSETRPRLSGTIPGWTSDEWREWRECGGWREIGGVREDTGGTRAAGSLNLVGSLTSESVPHPL